MAKPLKHTQLARIAGLIHRMLIEKASGLDFTKADGNNTRCQ